MREYVLVFLVAASVTYLLTVIAREIALRTGAFAKVRDRDVHDTPIPYLGGMAMYGGLVAAYLVARELPFLSRSQESVFSDARYVLIAGGVICAVGVLDDIFELDALTKLGGQILAGGVLVWFGIQYTFFTTQNGGVFSLDPTQGALLTVLVVVATVNAVNMVDGLDGLAAGVIGIGAAAMFVYCYVLTAVNNVTLASTGALLSASLAGVCIGFLPHNVNPARLFMGDSGSMLLGLVLSASALTFTTQFNPNDLTAGVGGGEANLGLIVALPVYLPIALLVIPVADLVLAVIRRTRAGRSPFAPDKQHLHHRMLEIGHSHRRAVLIMWLWAALIAFGAVGMSLASGPELWVTLAAGFVITVAGTFVLPRVQAPRVARSE